MFTARRRSRGAHRTIARRVAGLALGLALTATLATAPTTAQAAIAPEPPGTPTSATLSFYKGAPVKQANNYYCTPAAVRAALSTMNVTLPSQSTIASAIGTSASIPGTPDLAKVPGYLNGKKAGSSFIRTTGTVSSTTLLSRIQLMISYYKTPVIVSIQPYGNLSYWGGSRKVGHTVLVYGYSSSTINIWDPVDASWNNDTLGFQKVTVANLAKAMNDPALGGAEYVW